MDSFHRLVGISLVGHLLQIGGTNPTYDTEITHLGGEFHALPRRYARYRKARSRAIDALKSMNKDDGGFYDWETIHSLAQKQRHEEGYDSAGAKGPQRQQKYEYPN